MSSSLLHPPAVPSGLYPVIDLEHFPHLSFYETCEAILKAGCPWLQLRAKAMPEPAFQRDAAEVAYLKIHNPFLLIINHSVEIAEKIGADGVHLNTQSMPIQEARKRLGSTALIGYSAHSKEEALRAEDAGANYVSLGAIFETPYKSASHPIHGLEGLWKTVDALSIPVIAVGGIGTNEVPLLFNRKEGKPVHGFSVIRALLEKKDVTAAAKQLMKKWISCGLRPQPTRDFVPRP